MAGFLSKASNWLSRSLGASTSIVSPVHYYVDTVHYSPVCGRCPLYFRTVLGADLETSRRTSRASPRPGPRPRGTVRAALIEAARAVARARRPAALGPLLGTPIGGGVP